MVDQVRGFLNAHNTVSCFGSNFRAALVHGNSGGGAAVEVTGDGTQISSVYGYQNGTNTNLTNSARAAVYMHGNIDKNWIGDILGDDEQGTPTQYCALVMAGSGSNNMVANVKQEGGVLAANTSGQAFFYTSSGTGNVIGIGGNQTIAYNAAAWDPVNGNFLEIALTAGGGTLVNPPTSTLVEGAPYFVRLTQDATGGRTFSFGTSFTVVSTLDLAANAVTTLSFVVSGGVLVEVARPLLGGLAWAISGGGSAITTGLKYGIRIPYSGTIKAAYMIADTSCSASVEVWKKNNAVPGSGDKISASAPLALSSAQVYSDTTLTGWTVAVTAGDVFYFNVNSVSGAGNLLISLDILRTHT
jgi:hypothetical protein